MDMPSDGVVIHHRVKVKARANEVKCNGIIGGEICGATVFWITLLRDSIKIQCITCYSEQKLRGPGIKKAIALLKASEKNKLLPIGKTIVESKHRHDRFKILTQGAEENVLDNQDARRNSERDSTRTEKN